MAKIKEVLQGLLGEDSIEYLAQHYPSMQLLTNLTEAEIMAIPGVSKAKAKNLAAVIRVGKACLEPDIAEPFYIRSPGDVYNFCRHMGLLEEEHVICLFLTTKNKVLSHKLISKGSLNSSIMHPREVFSHGVRLRAASVICCHNHPSGDTTPSTEDVEISKRLKESGHILGIEMIDHIIIGAVGYLSLKEKGLL